MNGITILFQHISTDLFKYTMKPNHYLQYTVLFEIHWKDTISTKHYSQKWNIDRLGYSYPTEGMTTTTKCWCTESRACLCAYCVGLSLWLVDFSWIGKQINFLIIEPLCNRIMSLLNLFENKNTFLKNYALNKKTNFFF